MADIQRFETALDKMVELLVEMKKSLKEEPAATKITAQATHTPALPRIPKESPKLNDFSDLKAAVLSSDWPPAVNPTLICDVTSDKDKFERARGIIELMVAENLKGRSFLDYGCGQGHVARIAADQAPTVSVGYDIQKHEKWGDLQQFNVALTDDFEFVKSQGPYDVVTLFDVIDHLEQEDALTVLERIKGVLKEDGKLYMRCHPWSSRHATHLYHSFNKAFVHVIFTEDELKEILPPNSKQDQCRKLIRPLATYCGEIAKAGLVELSRREITSKVEPFFQAPIIAERIKNNMEATTFPTFQLGLEFVDFVVGKSKT